MKFLGLKLTLNDFIEVLPMVITVSFLTYYRNIKIVNVLASLAIGLMATIFFHTNVLFSNTICALSLLLITYYAPEGFTSMIPTVQGQGEVRQQDPEMRQVNEPRRPENAKRRRRRRRNKGALSVEALTNEEDDDEGFMNNEIYRDNYKSLEDDEEEGFMNMNKVLQNISTAGYTSPGFGVGAPLVEGFEDEKKPETKSKPAPVAKKEEMAMPFKLGEIPTQVKNGPHIDASSTLMKAIHSLNPDQINAMTKDTKQLIETQKSLMGMLGSMKPMMNDGKELMETFQEMFGKQ